MDRLAGLLGWLGPRCPIVARQVADNMRSLGLYSAEEHRGYFAELGGHFAGALHALRCAPGSAGTGMSADLARIAAARVELDASVDRLRQAVQPARGAILMGPHIANYLLNLACLNQVLPLTVYLRHSDDARRQAAKERWYQATGVGWIAEPADAGGPLGRLGRMAAAIAAGRTLFITPDLPQKAPHGVAVRFFDREIRLPEGPALLALRTGAPLFMLTAEPAGARQRLVVHGPCTGDGPPHGRAARRVAMEQRMQWFADHFAQFLTAHAALWYLWGDKRWTQLLHDDPRYGRRLAEPAPRHHARPAVDVVGAT
jgi:lauroyl/myristoyl acyltransferase